MRAHALISRAKAALPGTEGVAGPARVRPEVRHILHAPRPQAKLTVGSPDDAFEKEADEVAGQVMRMSEPGVQRMCTECEEEAKVRRAIAINAPTPQTTRQRDEEEVRRKALPSETGGGLEDEAARAVASKGSGRPLSAESRRFFEPRFGADFSAVRLHDGPPAERSVRGLNARAFAYGSDVWLGAGERESDRSLLAHELVHVVQQSGADREPNPVLSNVVQRQPTQYYEKSEVDVAESVIEALQQSNNIAGLNVDPAFEILNPYPLPFQMRILADLYDRNYFHGLLGYLAPGTKASHRLIVAIRFTQCQKDPNLLAYEDILEAQKFLKYEVPLPAELKSMFECLERERARHEKQREAERRQREKQKDDDRFAAVFEPGSEFCHLKKGMMKWRLYPSTSAGGKGKKQRMQIKFLPGSAYRNKTVTFLQTLREEGGDGIKTTIDIGVNQSVFRPFYGVDWDKKMTQWVPSDNGKDIGFRSQPNSADDPAAYLFDEPYFFPPPHGRVFESVAVVLETGETLGALTWGVGAVPSYAEKPKCADTPSADFHGAVEKFYTPKSPAPGYGQENYDLILDGFAPNDAALTAGQKKQLDSIAAMVTEIIGKGDPEVTKNHLVVGGFGDSMDTDPMAASEQRTQAVANYLTGVGIPQDTLDLRPFGATWARYEVSTKKAREGRNRRVQIRLFPP
jgi:outer membrane protein OmpA-like peptidoglycan-associated protein